MMPCESCPARLALTQPVATALASSSDAPAALSSAVPIRVRRSAWTIGMGFPLGMPARYAGLVHCRLPTWSQSGGRRARAEYPPQACHRHGLARGGFHPAEWERGLGLEKFARGADAPSW